MNVRPLHSLMIVLIVGSYINCLYEHSDEIRRSLAGTVVHAPSNQCGHDESGCFCRGALIVSTVRADDLPTLVRFLSLDDGVSTLTLAALVSPLSAIDDGSSTDAQGDTVRSGRELRTRLVSLLN